MNRAKLKQALPRVIILLLYTVRPPEDFVSPAPRTLGAGKRPDIHSVVQQILFEFADTVIFFGSG